MTDAIVLTRPIGGGSSISGLETTIINGHPMLTLEDTTRSDKVLTIAENVLLFAENKIADLDWIQISNAQDAESGFIATFDGTVVNISAHCENTGGNSKEIRLYINGVDTADLGTLSGGTNATINDTTLDLDFDQGDRIRLRAINGSGGNIQDTVIKLTVKWRGA